MPIQKLRWIKIACLCPNLKRLKQILFINLDVLLCLSAEFQAVCSSGVGITTDGRGEHVHESSCYYRIKETHQYLTTSAGY